MTSSLTMGLALVLLVLLVGCDSGGVIIVKAIDASPDATESDAAPDAPECPSPNPGAVPCEDALSCPVVPIGSCGYWDCPPNDAGQSFCTWIVKDAGP